MGDASGSRSTNVPPSPSGFSSVNKIDTVNLRAACINRRALAIASSIAGISRH
jgi:hypothetical protein